MKENLWLLIVLIVIFILLQVLFFKALDFEDFEFNFEIESAIVNDVKQKVSKSLEPKPVPKKQPISKSKTKEHKAEHIESYRTAKKLINDKQYKKALKPINELLIMYPETPKFWYEKIRALYGLHDCEVMGAMKTYLNLCETSDDCFKGGVEWSKKTYKSLKKSYCKS